MRNTLKKKVVRHVTEALESFASDSDEASDGIWNCLEWVLKQVGGYF